jgi:Flp pilus assembly protein TadD
VNILNKQTITVATALFLWLGAIEIGFAKPPAGGAGHMQRGIELAQQKQYDAAIAEFTKAIQANPKDARGYTNRGTAYRASNRLADAIADFSKAIEVAPKDEVAYRERGNTQVMQSQFETALQTLIRPSNSSPMTRTPISFAVLLRLDSTSGTKRSQISPPRCRSNRKIHKIMIAAPGRTGI